MPALDIRTESWPLKEPFRISGYTFTHADVIVVTLEESGHFGMGEAAGVYYHEETPASLTAQIEAVRSKIESGLSREKLRELLPPGGARNALDCALWDLESKLSGTPAWQRAGVEFPAAIESTYTIGADTPEKMAVAARNYVPAPRLKMKLTGDEDDAARVAAVRAARADAWIGVDANQAYDRARFEKLYPALVNAQVGLIEQPVRIGQEAELDGFRSAILLAADESVQSLEDIAKLKTRFDVVNIKLDKCGGLTEALMMARATRAAGLRPMVGCMAGTSLAMIPGSIVGQLCDFVDMDGAIVLAKDREPAVTYRDGNVMCPKSSWGAPDAALRAAS